LRTTINHIATKGNRLIGDRLYGIQDVCYGRLAWAADGCREGDATLLHRGKNKSRGAIMRIGMGYDVHRLVPDRKLILGGVVIPHPLGLAGHSDADVLIHAVCDALLGAAALGDIGLHFPDTDPAFRGIDSLELLRRSAALVAGEGLAVRQIDVTVVAQAPRIGPFREQIRSNLAGVLGIALAMTSVKATTTEGLGALGREEGIAAMCIAQLTRP
jgi:2-C-methyl-D-erythritol 2,4-cyclodiphosphate synthase